MSFKDEFGYHEVIDRVHVLTSMLNDHITTHPVVADDEKLLRFAEKAEIMLMTLYQEAANKSDALFEQSEETEK